MKSDFAPKPWEIEQDPQNPTINPKGIKGLWIPGDILNDKDLTWQEKILLTYIYHLDTTPSHCYASNRYIGELMGISEKTVANVLSSLKKKNKVSTVFWDGRMRSLKVNV
jgi:hypothetical protein